MKTEIKKIEKEIQVIFRDKKLLLRSLIHKSFNKEHNNEKLEFLGDRVIGLVISKKLLTLYPHEKEGTIDKKFASLVNKKTCANIAISLNLKKFIKTGNSYKNIKSTDEKILSDSCEALIGAIYLDQGIKVAEKIVLNLWSDELKNSVVTKIDAKTRLQEYSLKKFKTLPVYKLIHAKGPHHKPTFKIEVKIKKCKPEYGFGSSKKIAEQDAANILIKKIDNI